MTRQELTGGFVLYTAQAVAALDAMPERSVHLAVFSPPYWGLRDYGTDGWHGGDPDCQHEVSGQRPDPKNPAAITAAVRPSALPVCRKCGAERATGQIGQEPLHDCLGWATGAACGGCYVCHIVGVFRALRRVLRDDGTVWLNIADSYAGSWGNYGARHGQQRPQTQNKLPRRAYEAGATGPGYNGRPPTAGHTGLKPKDRAGIPERVILALQADGWWYRQDVIWAKIAAMPESVTDRPSRASEHVYMLAKSQHYYYDQDGCRESLAESTTADHRNGTGRHTQGLTTSKYYDAQTPDGTAAEKPSWYRTKVFVNPAQGRNLRDVWSLAPEASKLAFCANCGEAYTTAQMKRFSTRPGPDGKPQKACPNCLASDRWVAHFAAFPSELPRRAIAVGTSEHGVCATCGAPWRRVVKRTTMIVNRTSNHPPELRTRTSGTMIKPPSSTTIGWQPTCTCPGRDGDAPWPDVAMHPDGAANWPVVPATVLDPFVGSGTTLIVAKRLGRRGIGIDLRADYIALTAARLARTQPALTAAQAEPPDPEPAAAVQFELGV